MDEPMRQVTLTKNHKEGDVQYYASPESPLIIALPESTVNWLTGVKTEDKILARTPTDAQQVAIDITQQDAPIAEPTA